jgi:hypothetical protein
MTGRAHFVVATFQGSLLARLALPMKSDRYLASCSSATLTHRSRICELTWQVDTFIFQKKSVYLV